MPISMRAADPKLLRMRGPPRQEDAMTLMRSTLLAAVLSLAAGAALAGDVTAAQISEALSPKAATRSMTESRSAGEEAAFVDTLRNRGTRSLSVAERDRVAVIAADRPKID
jgi:hypothetical protein